MKLRILSNIVLRNHVISAYLFSTGLFLFFSPASEFPVSEYKILIGELGDELQAEKLVNVNERILCCIFKSKEYSFLLLLI